MLTPLQDMVDKFNRKTAKDEELRTELEGIEKRVNLDLGEESYRFVLADAKAGSLEMGLFEEADVTITSDPDTMMSLMEKTLRPMRAFAQKRFTVKGKLEDLFHLRKLF